MPDTFVKLLEVDNFHSLLDQGATSMMHDQMQQAYHLLALHCDVAVLLEVCASKIQHLCHLNEHLSAWIAGSEDYHSKIFTDQSGAKVRIRPRLSWHSPSLLLEASGTSVELRHLDNMLNIKSENLKARPLYTISLFSVSGCSLIIFEGSESENDTINLVPYYGRHHNGHDDLVLHTPLLSNPTTASSVMDSVSFKTFLEKFLEQMERISQEYTPELHGDTLDLSIHFGRMYTLRVPKTLTEDTDPFTVKSLQWVLKTGFETKARNIMSLGCT